MLRSPRYAFVPTCAFQLLLVVFPRIALNIAFLLLSNRALKAAEMTFGSQGDHLSFEGTILPCLLTLVLNMLLSAVPALRMPCCRELLLPHKVFFVKK
jgi:hypothetical protein